MKTHSLKNNSVVQGLGRLSKFVVIAGVAALAALPLSADARERHRHRGPDRHDRDRYEYRGEYRGDRHRHDHRAPVRGWARPGWYGAYPPVGYTDYRYIRTLPHGYRTVYRGGSRYYYANGAYYYPARYNGSGVYLNIRF